MTDATSGGKRLHWISVGFKRDEVAQTPSDQLKQCVELPAWVKGLARFTRNERKRIISNESIETEINDDEDMDSAIVQDWGG